MRYDLILRGGDVIDPSTGLRGNYHVAINAGRIAAITNDLQGSEARCEVDARGCFVVPGLIDLHVHAYTHSPLGLDPDSLCAAGGVTTMLDAGTAGSYNFGAFRRDGIDRCRTRVLALVNLS